MSPTKIDVALEAKRAGRRFGYSVAIALNVAMLIAVQFIVEWGWLPFLTEAFADLIPWISVSLMAIITANLIYLFNDEPIVKSSGQILTNLISVFVTYRIYQVFPFDFAEATFSWEAVVRVVLILAMVGAGIGVLVEAVKLASIEPRQERR